MAVAVFSFLADRVIDSTEVWSVSSIDFGGREDINLVIPAKLMPRPRLDCSKSKSTTLYLSDTFCVVAK